MRVDNIFELVNRFSKKEDQISASYGFILKNNKKVLQKFLGKVKIHLNQKELKKVDIETQVPHDSGKSRIDLQLTIYDEFLIFVESKLFRNEEKIVDQLEKYKQVLESKKVEYKNNIRLVYVNKQRMKKEIVQKLREKLELSRKEFFVFSWEDLVDIAEECHKKETIKLFKQYIGDAMHAKKVINEQKIKDIVEVLVVYTTPAYWELVEKGHIVVQGNSSPDAKYVALLRTNRGEGKRSAITHVAEVKYTKSYVPRNVTYKKFPDLIGLAKKKGHDLKGTHKHYVLGEVIELAKEIPHLKGEGSKAQVRFSTKMSELLRAKSVGEIRTLSKLKG